MRRARRRWSARSSRAGRTGGAFHIYAGSQALDAGAIAETQAATLALAARLADEAGAAPPLVNLGGGFGVPYFAGDVPLDVEAVGAALARHWRRGPPFWARPASRSSWGAGWWRRRASI